MSEIRGNSAYIGLNLTSTISQKKEGELSFALNAQIEGVDGESITYQNEQGNKHCFSLPDGYKVIGSKNIIERGYIVYFLVNGSDSEIGKVNKNTCLYQKIINSPCLGFNINKPIHKIISKVTNCSTELYWADGGMKYIDLENLPYKETRTDDTCNNFITSDIDCNKILVQPDFLLPSINYEYVGSDGELIAGAYQFAIQYSTSQGDPYTSLFGLTNPLSVNDPLKVTEDFNYQTNKSITLTIDNIDVSGIFRYINIVVIKTINNISSPELVETRKITGKKLTITYTGASKQGIKLSIDDIFETFPIYDNVDDIFTVQDVIGWSGLSLHDRINYQAIASKIHPRWQTYKLNSTAKDDYSKGINTATTKGYMRDEIYPLEIVFHLKRGRVTDSFPMVGREATSLDLEIISNGDTNSSTIPCDPSQQSLSRWKVYNTGYRVDYSPEYLNNQTNDCFSGPYEYGEFAYVESTDFYPCDPEIWGELAGKPIRHFRFPDSSVTHIHDENGNIYPIGIKIDVDEIKQLIRDSTLTQEQKDEIIGFSISRGNRATNKSVIAKGLLYNVGKYRRGEETYFFPNYPYNDLRPDPFLSTQHTGDDSRDNPTLRLNAFSTEDSKKRFTLHSPDTHFYQPFLGNELRVETIETGQLSGHFTEVKKHSRYKFLSTGSFGTSLGVAIVVGFASSTIGLSTNVFNGTAAFAAFATILSIIEKTLPKINFAYQYNSVGKYTNSISIPNDRGVKVRGVDIATYLVAGMTTAGDVYNINNYQRESSVYLRTTTPLPFPNELGGPVDNSRYVLGEIGCSNAIQHRIITSFYGSVKNNVPNLYGTINSYEIISTGFYKSFTADSQGASTIFGGDIFINRFALKRKMPFFIDNRVDFPDESDVFYDDLENVGFPTYWLSTNYKSEAEVDLAEDEKGIGKRILRKFREVLGIKINNFDCIDDKAFYQKGKFYLFAYGIPYFFCESEVNVDYRQATNIKEGDFFPHVGGDIPDEWLQEINTTIQQDNTYFYNKTFSKQNKEHLYTHLPLEYKERCERNYPNKAVYSDPQGDILNYKKNSWLVYRPISVVDFPINHGKLTSIEGIENRAILARFENKSLIYNALLTIDTSNPKAAYIGNDKLFTASPPIDFRESDLGYNGSQHKFFLRTENGNISIDAERGKVFVVSGRDVEDITAPKYKVNSFFQEHLPFTISKHFPDINIDNHFNNVGLHGVFDTKYNRLIITKLDYEPIVDGIQFINNKFYKNDVEISLSDSTSFCNKSFTISFDFDNGTWVSFHSYIPNFYIGENGSFFSGMNDGNGVWEHNKEATKFNTFYGKTFPYILEYSFNYKANDEIIQSVADETRAFRQINEISKISVEDAFFNKVIISNDNQCSGLRILVPKKKRNLADYLKYPKYNIDSVSILVDKTDSKYNYNGFWDVVVDHSQPIFTRSCSGFDKELNQSNMNYKPLSFKKFPIRGGFCLIRHILDDRNDVRLISKFILTTTQESHK